MYYVPVFELLWAVLEVELVVNLNCPYQKVRLLIGTAIANYLSQLCLVWLVQPCAWLLCLFSQFRLNSTASWAELMLPTVWPSLALDGTEMCLSWAQAWHVSGYTLKGGGLDAAHFIHGLVKGGYSNCVFLKSQVGSQPIFQPSSTSTSTSSGVYLA